MKGIPRIFFPLVAQTGHQKEAKKMNLKKKIPLLPGSSVLTDNLTYFFVHFLKMCVKVAQLLIEHLKQKQNPLIQTVCGFCRTFGKYIIPRKHKNGADIITVTILANFLKFKYVHMHFPLN